VSIGVTGVVSVPLTSKVTTAKYVSTNYKQNMPQDVDVHSKAKCTKVLQEHDN